MTNHSPEPWEVVTIGVGEVWIVRPDGQGGFWEVIAECERIGEEQDTLNARRIVAAVNACKYLPTILLEWLAKHGRFLEGSSLPENSWKDCWGGPTDLFIPANAKLEILHEVNPDGWKAKVYFYGQQVEGEMADLLLGKTKEER